MLNARRERMGQLDSFDRGDILPSPSPFPLHPNHHLSSPSLFPVSFPGLPLFVSPPSPIRLPRPSFITKMGKSSKVAAAPKAEKVKEVKPAKEEKKEKKSKKAVSISPVSPPI